MKDARKVFDDYTVASSHLHELVEVLQYTYIFGTRCLGQMLKIENGQFEHDGMGHQELPTRSR